MPVPGPRAFSAIRDGALVLRDAAADEDPLAQGALFELLADAVLQGLRDVVLLDTGRGGEMVEDIRRFNALLASRGLSRLRLRRAERGTKLARKARDILEESASVGRRRGILAALEPGGEDDSEAEPALARLQASGAGDGTTLFAYVPVIEAARCTGCDACLRVCPRDSLTQINDGAGKSRYHCDPSTCDACGLCADVCDFSAIKIDTMARQPDDIALADWVCTACGVQVHAPDTGTDQTGTDRAGLCHVCARNGAHRTLFQVLP